MFIFVSQKKHSGSNEDELVEEGMRKTWRKETSKETLLVTLVKDDGGLTLGEKLRGWRKVGALGEIFGS